MGNNGGKSAAAQDALVYVVPFLPMEQQYRFLDDDTLDTLRTADPRHINPLLHGNHIDLCVLSYVLCRRPGFFENHRKHWKTKYDLLTKEYREKTAQLFRDFQFPQPTVRMFVSAFLEKEDQATMVDMITATSYADHIFNNTQLSLLDENTQSKVDRINACSIGNLAFLLLRAPKTFRSKWRIRYDTIVNNIRENFMELVADYQFPVIEK